MAAMHTDTQKTFTALFDTQQKKYGLEYSLTMFIERIAVRRQKPRVILRITSIVPNV
jgi:hypothetical protein